MANESELIPGTPIHLKADANRIGHVIPKGTRGVVQSGDALLHRGKYYVEVDVSQLDMQFPGIDTKIVALQDYFERHELEVIDDP